MLTPTEILARVRDVVGPGSHMMHEPMIGDAERDLVAECVAKGVIGYEYVNRLQEKMAEVCGTEQSLVLSSGTAALHLALMVAGVEPFQEVLVPALSFVASANAVCYCRAIPNFIDIRETDLGINPFKLKQYLHRSTEKRDGGRYSKTSGRKIAAIVAVDLLGVPADMDQINDIASNFGLPVIEDAAEALGSKYNGRPCGSLGYVGAVSFNNNKIVTSNGGGALLTNEPWVQAKAWSLGTTARVEHPWRMEHTEVSWNYRMGNVNAALALPQLDRLPAMLESKRKLHQAYRDSLGDLAFEAEGQGLEPNHWLNAIMLPDVEMGMRDQILDTLHKAGVPVRTVFTPLHHLPMFKDNPRDNVDVAVNVWKRMICLPSSARLGAAL